MGVKVGWACGVCSRCGRKVCRERSAELAVCDCWQYCPLCGRKMESYAPDTQALRFYEKDDMEVVMICRYHTPPYKSKQKPIEVMLT